MIGARARSFVLVAAFGLAACSRQSRLSIVDGMGPRPVLPPPESPVVPTVEIAAAIGWPAGGRPTPGEGLSVNAFATGLDHPRWLYVLPNGDVLVAETNAPPRPEQGKGVKGWLFDRYQRKAGGAVPSANRITLLRDADGNGVAERSSVFAGGLNSPFGIVLVGNDLYIADTDALVRMPYTDGQTKSSEAPVTVTELPAGPFNYHWTRNVAAAPDGSRLYVAIGSNSNAGENGIEQEKDRAAIWEIDSRSGAHRVLASGLRNPVGMAFESETGALWTVVNERDELGNDLVPDYMTAVRDGAFYGWPFSYFGGRPDPRVNAQSELPATAVVPDYALGSHTASMGLADATGTTLPARFHHGMFVGQHGSWNRKPRSGYKVIFVPFRRGRPAGLPFDVLSGFVTDDGEARGRPVGVAIDKRGALLVADDVGNTIWRVTGSESPRTE
jgi:glucose/arabinose dehydrogenase